jgi:hypothetical protein
MKRLFNLLLPVLLAVFCTTAWAGQDLELVDGEHWVSSSHEQKGAFLFGVGNILEIEIESTAYEGCVGLESQTRPIIAIRLAI